MKHISPLLGTFLLLLLQFNLFAQSNALLFIENRDKFPSNDNFVNSRIQNSWRSNVNHDTVKIRIHNKGIGTLTITKLTLSNSTKWKFLTLKGVTFSSSQLPFSIAPGASPVDLTLLFIAANQATRVAVLHETLTINSNDDKFPVKTLFLHGLWQYKGEGSNEPYAQEVINTFNFKTSTGFARSDPDKGDPTKPKGSQIISSFFVRADNSKPVTVRQMDAYHTCCTSGETISWYPKGNLSGAVSIVRHMGSDAQSLLPRKSASSPAEGSFNPTTPFALKIANDKTDASSNSSGKIGARIWRAIDANGKLIPNIYIISNDYLGTSGTNYDYNDNMYYVSNLKPEVGTAYYSALSATPSALDFGSEKLLQTTNTLQITLKSLGQTYSNGTSDPTLIIDSVRIKGENKSEFSVAAPLKTSLTPQGTTTVSVTFKPVTQGMKIADLLIYYNNSLSPHRVPLYAVAKTSGTIFTAHFRINSGSSTSLTTINGKTWEADTKYSYDNLEPYTNGSLRQLQERMMMLCF